MIKTITSNARDEFDQLVNDFEKGTVYPTGVSRVFATQTHVTVVPGCAPVYTAVIFYKDVKI